ncbi:MAG: hypothetical protein MZV70_74765 [Desulfobacterales bacterium]|nr:hypothetical protein [Desulfobacterales bacterium]
MMEKGLGEEPKPMVLMSKLIPEWIPETGPGAQIHHGGPEKQSRPSTST